MIDHTLLIPPNTEHRLPSIAIWSCSRCRWYAWSYPWSFTLRTLKIYPLFIASHNSVEKWLSFVSGEQHFASGFSVFPLSFIRFTWNPLSHLLHLPMAFERTETASRVTFNWSASRCCVWASSSSSDACNSLSRNFFGGLARSSFLASKLPLLNLLNHPKHCDLPRAGSP